MQLVLAEIGTSTSDDAVFFGGDLNVKQPYWDDAFPNIPGAGGLAYVPLNNAYALTSLSTTPWPEGDPSLGTYDWGSQPYDKVLYNLGRVPRIKVDAPQGDEDYGVFDVIQVAGSAGSGKLYDSLSAACEQYAKTSSNKKITCSSTTPFATAFWGARAISDHLPIYFDIMVDYSSNPPPSPPPQPPPSPKPAFPPPQSNSCTPMDLSPATPKDKQAQAQTTCGTWVICSLACSYNHMPCLIPIVHLPGHSRLLAGIVQLRKWDMSSGGCDLLLEDYSLLPERNLFPHPRSIIAWHSSLSGFIVT